MSVAEQVQYESRVRFMYGVVAFVAALLIVAAQLTQLSGTHAPVSELTLDLIAASQRGGLDIVGAILEGLGLAAVGALLFWLHQVSTARRPEMKSVVRWIAVAGAALAAVGWIAFWIIYTHKAHQFVNTGSQSYPEANDLTGSGAVAVLPIVFELGWLLLAMGCILTCLSAMRVGLITRLVGYTGVVAGALFLFQIPVLGLVIQAFWLAALAVTLARRWPSGDPPAWDAGVAIPWTPLQSSQGAQDQRRAGGQRRRKVSDADVLAAVDDRDAQTPTPRQRAGRRKRKRRG